MMPSQTEKFSLREAMQSASAAGSRLCGSAFTRAFRIQKQTVFIIFYFCIKHVANIEDKNRLSTIPGSKIMQRPVRQAG
jgi:hypothetical protein